MSNYFIEHKIIGKKKTNSKTVAIVVHAKVTYQNMAISVLMQYLFCIYLRLFPSLIFGGIRLFCISLMACSQT